MNRREHLLTILGEEGVEIAQRASKALRFGLAEIQPGQDLDNSDRMRGEYIDMLAVWEMLVEEGLVADVHYIDRLAIDAKKAKVEKFLLYSQTCGTLSENPTPAPIPEVAPDE